MNPLARLNLVFPPALETAVLEAFGADPTLPGFTMMRVEGHTSNFARASAAEQVRGHVERRLLWMILPEARCDEVLARLREAVASREVRWWIEPVARMGRLA